MAKGKSTWRYNKLLTARRNYYNIGGELKDAFNFGDMKVASASPMSGAVGALGQAVGQAGGALIGGGLESGAGKVLSGLSGIASKIPGPWGAAASAALGIVGGLTNRMFGSKLNQENIANVENITGRLNNASSSANSFDELNNSVATTVGGMNFSDSYIGEDGWFSNKAKEKAAALREEMRAAEKRQNLALINNAEMLSANQIGGLEANYAAFGGGLNTHGGDFTNGMIFINNGGSHESNPFDGVPIGVDENGTPNLVEEGETIFNDYVFSKRLTVPKAIRNKYKLRGIKDISFADASKQMAKESEERPNDPISQRGLVALMSDLASSQEGIKDNDMSKEFAKGGYLFADGGDSKSKDDNLKPGKYADWLRYAPAVGFGIGTLTDLLGLTNKPDYSNADAILEATRGSGTYQPVEFNPIGNYLAYNPLDRDYYLNKLSAEAGATRRAALQNAGMNRGAGMAAILAADNNAQNQMGTLARQAEEYNLAQRQQVEDFNRATNTTNSQGFLQADIANQKAQADMRDFSLKGTMAASQMRESARQAADAAKSANLSGLFQTLGDIGYEEKNAKMRDWAIRHGIFGPGTEDYGRFRKTTVKANGGKIKRRKGLTF